MSDALRDVWDHIWGDVTSRVDASAVAVLVPLAVVAVALLVPAVWRLVRHVVTIAHEGGHALVAALMGRRVSGIRLHADTSGLTTHSGTAKRLPLALTAFAGYPAPGVLGVGAAWLLHSGRALALLWAVVALLVVVLVQIRNAFGLLVMVVALGGFGWLAWAGAEAWRVGVAYGVTWLLLLGGVRAVVELQRSRRGGRGRDSDADALARATRIGGLAWVGAFWLVTVACALGGAWLMAADAVGIANS